MRAFTLLEIVVTMAVLLTGMVAMTSTTVRLHVLQNFNRERRTAENTMRSVAEQIRAVSARELINDPDNWSANVIAAFDPDGPTGGVFVATGLEPAPGEDFVGSILLVTDETATDEEVDAELGLPADLDGDGLTDNLDVTATARILPVVLRMRWTGVSGPCEIEHAFFLSSY